MASDAQDLKANCRPVLEVEVSEEIDAFLEGLGYEYDTRFLLKDSPCHNTIIVS